MKDEIRKLLEKEELTDKEVELVEKEIERLEKEIDYEERKLKVCGYGKEDLYYIEELQEDLEELKEIIYE